MGWRWRLDCAKRWAQIALLPRISEEAAFLASMGWNWNEMQFFLSSGRMMFYLNLRSLIFVKSWKKRTFLFNSLSVTSVKRHDGKYTSVNLTWIWLRCICIPKIKFPAAARARKDADRKTDRQTLRKLLPTRIRGW